MINDYIFCPFCGEVEWLVDKTGTAKEGRLAYYKCKGCKKFSYTNISMPFKSTILECVTEVKRYEVKAEIEPYIVTIAYLANKTIITDSFSRKPVIELDKVIEFDWYKDDKILEKIKFYLVFS